MNVKSDDDALLAVELLPKLTYTTGFVGTCNTFD